MSLAPKEGLLWKPAISGNSVSWDGELVGSRVVDLAWREFQFKNRYPRHTFAVRALFEGYGSTPPSQLREEALRIRLEQLRRQ